MFLISMMSKYNKAAVSAIFYPSFVSDNYKVVNALI